MVGEKRSRKEYQDKKKDTERDEILFVQIKAIYQLFLLIISNSTFLDILIK